MRFESTLHPIVCGRSRKNIKLIESITNTAIYFPPFAQLHRYCPPNAKRRNPEEIFITGENPQGIELAKRKIHELVNRIKLFMKDAVVAPPKIDSILLGRMDKIRKIMETNGTYIMFPPLASQRNMIRVQGIEGLHIERTMKEIMSLVRIWMDATLGLLRANQQLRLANSTMLRGGSSNLACPSSRVLTRFVPCSVIFVPIPMRTFRSRRCLLPSTAQMTL